MEVMTVVEGKVPHARIKEFHTAFASMRGKPRPLRYDTDRWIVDD